MIELRAIGHTYRSLLGRRVRAVDDVTLDVAAGEILGIAGPNGAGKSTLIALLLGYLEPTDGELRIAGERPRRYVERHGVAYLSELIAIPPNWRVHQALVRYATLAGVAPQDVEARVEVAITMLGLEEHRGKKARQLSKGNLQRLGLAQALLRQDEQLFILDEPTHGLDPVWTHRFRTIVESLRRDDRVILIASHNLDELERLADRVAIFDHGRLQRVVSPRGAPNTAREGYRLVVAAGADRVLDLLPGAERMGGDAFLLPATDVVELNDALARFLADGGLISELAPARTSLERHFREAIADGGE